LTDFYQIANYTLKMSPHYIVKSKKSSFSTINHLGHLLLQLDKFSEHEIWFIFSPVRNCPGGCTVNI